MSEIGVYHYQCGAREVTKGLPLHGRSCVICQGIRQAARKAATAVYGKDHNS